MQWIGQLARREPVPVSGPYEMRNPESLALAGAAGGTGIPQGQFTAGKREGDEPGL